jgi:hypothetical protein
MISRGRYKFRTPAPRHVIERYRCIPSPLANAPGNPTGVLPVIFARPVIARPAARSSTSLTPKVIRYVPTRGT